MIALRVVFRMGWALPNPAARMNEDRIICPFAHLEPSTAQTVTCTVKTGSGDGAVAVSGARVEMPGRGGRRSSGCMAPPSFAWRPQGRCMPGSRWSNLWI